MWEACEALRDALIVLGPAIDGGKDSLSMAAKVIIMHYNLTLTRAQHLLNTISITADQTVRGTFANCAISFHILR